MKRRKYYARTSKDELDDLRRTTMAKDPSMAGKVSNPDGGFYKSSEEVRMEDAERLTRSEIINAFGEDLGNKLLGGGYSSLSGMAGVTDEELLAIEGIGPVTVGKIREVISLKAPEVDDGLEEEAADEPEVEEAVDAEAEATETGVVKEEVVEVVAEELPADIEADIIETGEEIEYDIMPPDMVLAGTASITKVEPPPPGVSTRVLRMRERQKLEDEEKKRVQAVHEQVRLEAVAEPEVVELEAELEVSEDPPADDENEAPTE